MKARDSKADFFMCVRPLVKDLVAWETSNIMDPQAIKGIVGELAAVLGPKVVKNSAVALF